MNDENRDRKIKNAKKVVSFLEQVRDGLKKQLDNKNKQVIEAQNNLKKLEQNEGQHHG